ncbi:hypothetical protein HUG15_15870 [Salicibibacter cibarius]|uniref:Uncharacterized protein n=1 Tax=Salicibibacter cibarius TaxID=2743000 RepID=A0A7T6YZF2_9BACI|nr:hypothetical protein [Salicibibacter cibarius]QQK74155.1 hypothetical protein HUG15_15870 [Salicibibacter cibarius]
MKASNELMEKGIQQAHGCTHQEYRENVEKMIEVEKKREKDYEKAKAI